MRRGVTDASAWAGSALLTAAVVGAAVVLVREAWHWFIIPTALCGLLAGVDVVRWWRGQLDVFEPRAVVGVFAYHLAVVAPILHVTWDYWPQYMRGASDWRHSLGVLALINFAGLVVYRIAQGVPLARKPSPQIGLDTGRFVTLALFGGLVSFATWSYVVISMGGPVGYVTTVTQNREVLTGAGWLFLVAEAWPLLWYAAYLVHNRTHLAARASAPWLVLGLFALAQFAAGGLRGSRSNTIWPVLLALGITHLIAHRVTVRQLLVGAVTAGLFMYGYGFYKSLGSEAIEAAYASGSVASLETQTGRNEAHPIPGCSRGLKPPVSSRLRAM